MANEFICLIDNGKIIPNVVDKLNFNSCIKKYEGKTVTVNIKAFRESVSVRQHRYLRGGVYGRAIKEFRKAGIKIEVDGKYVNIDQDIINIVYKAQFITPKVVNVSGIERAYYPSTASFNTEQMAWFTDLVRMDLRSPDNIWNYQVETLDPEEWHKLNPRKI